MGDCKASTPPRASVGRPRIDDRLIINGILYWNTGRLSLDRVAVDSSTVKACKGGACRLRWVLEG